MPGPPTVAELVDLVVRLEDDPQQRNLLDSFPYELFRVAVGEGLIGQDGMFAFAEVVGQAVNDELLGYRRQHAGAHLRPDGQSWTEQEFQARTGYYSTVKGQQMAALFRERRERAKAVDVAPMPGRSGPQRDVFISHATKDNAAIARPLAQELQRRGLSVWFDEFELELGDSLRQKIDDGIKHSRLGVVILSPAFFERQWPAWELNGLVTRLMAGERNVVIPVWHEVDAEDVQAYSPSLADLVAAKSSIGVVAIADGIERALARRGWRRASAG